jgi:hypothetical protein
LATIIKYEQNLIPVTKGSADAIAQMMESLQLKKAWIKMLCINETELDKSVLSSGHSNRQAYQKTSKDANGAQDAGHHIVIIDMNGKNGVVLKRTGKEYVQQALMALTR